MGGHNMVAIGSGGSLVAASFASLLHEAATGRLARAATPLEAITRSPLRDTGALLLSARGTNSDIMRVARILPELGYDVVSGLTTHRGSPLERILTGYGATTHDFAVPGGKDGFLATNSLIATLVLLYRATALSDDASSDDGTSLVASSPSIEGSEEVWANRTLVVLAQGWAIPAALDLEARFSEAALANVTVTDPRNFAHGRHHWLSLHAADTGIVSLETKGSVRDAARTLRYLPKGTDILRVASAREGPTATIELVRAVMQITGEVAEVRGIDPGRPYVADFGRRLYRAGAALAVGPGEAMAITKKRKALFLGPKSHGEELNRALREFLDRLKGTSFSGLAIDYDGTLSAQDRRFQPLDTVITDQLNRLLAEDIFLGVISGRGSSVHEQLRAGLSPEYWKRVVVGLYNGARIIELAERVPRPASAAPQALRMAHTRLAPFETLLGFDVVERPYQLSLRPRNGPDPSELGSIVRDQLAEIKGISVFTSSHSVDVVAAGTSKTAIINALRAKRVGCILRIGDQGAAGGNDFELLNSGPSLSVDRVSSRLDTCWNLGGAGLGGPTLTLKYLQALHGAGGVFHLDVPSLFHGSSGVTG